MSIAAVIFAVALQQAPTAPPAPIAPGMQDPKELFAKSKCVLCHGEDGRGDTEKGRKFKAFLVKQPDGKIGFEFQPRAPKEKAEKLAQDKPTRRGSAPRARSTR